MKESYEEDLAKKIQPITSDASGAAIAVTRLS